MKKEVSRNYLILILSFICAFSLMIIPMGDNLRWFRPDFVSLVLIYWVINLPSRVGIGFAFVVGLLFDLFSGLLLGSMALILSIIAFLTINLRMRLKIYRYWQQFALIMLLIACGQLIRLWIQVLVGHPPTTILYWFSSLVSALVWPLVYLILHSFQRSL